MATVWEILEARGLDVERLSARGWRAEESRDGGEALAIPFVVDGKVVGEKYRRFGGDPDRKWFARWEAGPVAYNADCLKDPALRGLPLIITEGEIDCESTLQAGFLKVISPPNGAGGVGENRAVAELVEAKAYEWLRPLLPLLKKDHTPEVILATDGDEKGAMLMHELALQLGKTRCKFLTYPKTRWPGRKLDRCKDLNEVLEEYGAQGVRQTVARAAFIKVEGVYRMSELPPLPPDTIYDIQFKLLSENYKMRLGDFTVITGIPGLGKTSFVNDLCCRVSDRYGLKVAWASFEQAPQRDHKRALRCWKLEKSPSLWEGDDKEVADRWIDEHHVFIMPSDDDDPTLDWMLTCMEGAVVQHGCRIVVIDPWNELQHDRERGESETEYTGRAIKVLKRFAKVFQVHLILVAHPAKMQKVNGKYLIPTLYDISGSSNFYNKADIGIVIHRESAETTIVKVAKSRYHDTIGKPGEVEMEFFAGDRRFRENQRLA